jgi:hypothetical protein
VKGTGVEGGGEGLLVEAGASFIHGVQENPLTDLCADFGLYLYDPGEGVVMLDEDGSPVPEELDKRYESGWRGQ